MTEKVRQEIEVIKQVVKEISKVGFLKEQSVKDMYQLVMAATSYGEDGKEILLKLTAKLKWCILQMPKSEELHEMYWDCLRREAPYLFESFMLYMERRRKPSERFYQPRINPLKQVADGVQALADGELDELFVNLPPRTGKTTIVRLAQLWFASRNPERSNLYSAFSDKITKPFYNGIMEFITDPTYAYYEIFPKNKIVKTNGDDETIDLNRAKSYPTFTCRSIYGTLNGSCDCTGLAVADDLLSGIEEALSADRLETVWGKFDNNFMSRIKFDQGAKLINMGTRWALGDPQGRRQFLLENNLEYKDRRYRVVSIPALNDKEESNFDYPYGVGFSTQTYKQRRASFEQNADIASWFAQYQQEPIDRQGALFTAGNMKFYNGVLPVNEDGEVKPDRIFAAVDEAFGGGDFVSMPIAYQFGDAIYIHDVVFDDGDKFVTRPLIVEAIARNGIQAVQFEETKTTADYHEWVQNECADRGLQVTITTKAPSTQIAKRIRIFDKSPEIREMYFRDTSCRSAEYQKFITNLYEFKMEGKVKHDDAPDSLAQLCDMKIKKSQVTMIYNSPF